MRWVLQTNLGKDDDCLRVQEACNKRGFSCDLLKVIPFSGTIPNVPIDEPIVFYGGTNWVESIWKSGLWTPGVWFDVHSFDYDTLQRQYRNKCLNDSARISTFKEFIEQNKDVYPDKMFFIRPARDLKEFAGDVVRLGDFEEWYQRISHGGYSITPNTRIVVGEPFRITHEWRCFVVGARVIAASQYRKDHVLDIEEGCPDEVREFVETMACSWSPADVFVMDVGRCGSELYVIENNCFNSAGWYACDIDAIVGAVSELAMKSSAAK